VSNTFVFSKNLPYNSIVNPNVQSEDYLDFQSPFSFFDFLKYTKSDLSPTQFNDLYIDYIREWNTVKNNSVYQIDQTIKERYVELIKQITLKYTTFEEKRFLSNIDMNDPNDLDIIIPFYSKKIIEVCNFYSEKRERLKFKIQKNKIKGTEVSLEKAIFETITDVIFSDFFEVSEYQNPINEQELLRDLNIEIEELYDLYTNYLDNDPDETYETYDVKTELRKSLYSSNINQIDAELFINIENAIKKQIFEDVRVFLTEFGRIFTINYNVLDVNLNCKPDEKLFNLVNSAKPNATRLVELRNVLIKKYIGSDFYYITTGSTITDVTSGVLFKADNPTGNLLNRHFPTTASIEEESDLQSCRRIGLFFTPEKNSILYYSVPDKKYKIDKSKLEPEKLYVFPDPNLYGNTFGLKRNFTQDYPLIHICDYTKSVKNYSNFKTEGDIDINPYTQSFYGYNSRNQLNDSIYLNEAGLKTNFSSIYNKGILTRWTTDIFGNQFGLFKSKGRNNLIDTTVVATGSAIICEKYDGGPITFYENGFLPEVILANNPLWVSPNIWSSYYYYNLLIEGGVGGIRDGLMERGMFSLGYEIDGLTIDRSKLTQNDFDINLNDNKFTLFTEINGLGYTDTTFKWELNNPNTFNYTVDYVIEGKSYNRDPNTFIPPPTKVLDGNRSSNTSDFTPSFNNQYILSSIKYKEFDAGGFEESCETEFDFDIQTHHTIWQVDTDCMTVISTPDITENNNLFKSKNDLGEIYIKDVITGEVSYLSSGLSVQLKTKYVDFIGELYNKVSDFNIYNDFIWIKTENYLIFEKLSYENTGYVYSGTGESYIKIKNTENTIVISDPFIFENREYGIIAQLSAIDNKSNTFILRPDIYKINYNNSKLEKLTNTYPNTFYQNDKDLNPIKFRKFTKCLVNYNSRNNKYAILASFEDSNGLFYIYELKFDFNGYEMLNQSCKIYRYSDEQTLKTINFHDEPSLDQFLFNSPTGNVTPTFNQSEGELIFS
jgi:hypothetical protein